MNSPPNLNCLFAPHPCDIHQYKVNCDAVKMLPSITLHLGGHEYSLTQEDYILWVSIMLKC